MRTLLFCLFAITSCREADDKPNETDADDTAGVVDADGDGFGAPDDCDDNDSSIHPDAQERCDDIDNDCDGDIDDEDSDLRGAATWYADYDLDGYGGDQLSLEACEQPDGYVDNHLDCLDVDDEIHPNADEICDGLDNDCDGVTDGDDATDARTWYVDDDADGYGTNNSTVTACDQPAGYALHDGDCDDSAPSFHPGALESDCADPADYNCDGSTGYEDSDNDGFAACDDCDDSTVDANDDALEICDGIDNDCDGDIDGDDGSLSGGTVFYGDSDGDGYGGSQYQEVTCSAPPGFVANNDDCDDLDAASHPGASEVCDGADNDCDTDVDEGVGSTWYQDSDGDGYGNGSVTETACDVPSGYVGNALDCDDFSATTNPASYEVCDGADNDCDGSTDEGAINATTWYVDGDGDGYGSSASSTSACDQPSGYAANDTDCDDSTALVSPGASETCDSVDNDCDGTVDEADASDATTWYADLDGDGYGNASSTTTGCSQPSGHVADATDCDDTNVGTNPGVVEVCDSIDNNCDGTTDEWTATDATTWYQDADSDGFGGSTSTLVACDQPSGYASVDGDCNDDPANGGGLFNPGIAETCDGADNDCDGTADEELSGSAALCAATDCTDVYNSRTNAPTNGTYHVDPDGNGAYESYCDFTGTGGPWTWHTATEPIAYWSFNGSDVTASDVGGYSGTVQGNTQSSGTVPFASFGNSLQSDNNDSGRVDLSTSVPFGAQWTISFWARNNSCSNNQIPLLFDDNNAWLGDLYHTAAFWPGAYAFAIHDSSCTSYIHTWRHFVYQDEGGNIRVWFNGSELTGTSYDNYYSISGLGLNRLMSKPSFGTNGLSGQMDDLVIYDTPLSQAEIERLYNQGTAGRPARWQ